MLKYNHYRIKHSDIFNEQDYPNMVDELENLKTCLSHLPNLYKNDIIISYLKDHSLENIRISDNPKVAEMLTSGSFTMSHLEWLFESCRTHKLFTEDFEYYIKRVLTQ